MEGPAEQHLVDIMLRTTCRRIVGIPQADADRLEKAATVLPPVQPTSSVPVGHSFCQGSTSAVPVQTVAD